ncbi:hypothetical protein [Paraburkholderia fungorum]|uniref:hypothetical protein n=1 Tax=Paraburkholderia fungorum TaxID=134537 RepID=UPI001C1F005F|nr:hypothetical protein [Paraburkholderia fungorum]MBU7436508.1 hypothetical protein [Paraburkholderia fungorum]
MARRVQHQMANNVGVGQTAPIDWEGGEGTLYISSSAWGGGNAVLQSMAPDGNYYTLQNYATVTPISITANGTANFRAPAGKLSLFITTATGVSAWAVGVPSNAAG